jgi:tetratricopeptide (TPR) repeat protein
MVNAPLEAALARAFALLPQPALAEQQAREILRAVPGHPQALLVLGAAQRRQGRLEDANATLAPLAERQPQAPAVHVEWALVQAAQGQLPPAIASLRRAVRLNPALPGVWRHMGDLLSQAGSSAEAQEAYARHLESAISDPTLMRAAEAMHEGDLPRAEHMLRAHQAQYPTDVAALRMLAEIGTRLGRDADAEKILLYCLELMPCFALARHNLAIVLFRQNRAQEALPHIESLRKSDPHDPDYRALHAACLAHLAEFAGATDIYEKLLADFPEQPRIWLSYAHVLRTLGRRDEAQRAYRIAIAKAPHMGEAYWSLANLKSGSFLHAETQAMQAQLARGDLGAEDRFHLHYALGYVHEQDGDYARSWSHYAAGAKLRRAELTYSAAETTRQLARTRALMDAGFFAARAGWGCHDEAPIFIVGLPRSGSTLIEQILASHSQVEGTQELSEIANIARLLGRHRRTEDRYPETLADLDQASCRDLGERYLARTRIYRKAGKPIFIDKMPNNFIHAGLIHLILPCARIIDARRHPMATCFSAFKQHFAKGHHYSYDLDELGSYYLDYLALMGHFDAALPGRVHRVQYERMVLDTEGETCGLLAYCGLDFEPVCLRFHENERPVRTASSEQVRRPVFREGLDQWRHYEKWLGPLAARLEGEC